MTLAMTGRDGGARAPTPNPGVPASSMLPLIP